MQNEYTAKRYLTGADFDIESIQQVGSSYWFGDEFGPYLLEVSSADGKVLFLYFAVLTQIILAVRFDGALVRLPSPEQVPPFGLSFPSRKLP